MKKKWIGVMISISMLCTAIPGMSFALAGGYSDIPEGDWSLDAVSSARDYGLMQGVGDGVFGYGNTISKAEFITVLDRMFGWNLIQPETPSFTNISQDQWFYPYIETAREHNVINSSEPFDPASPITREEMAVMLVKALGYDTLAQSAVSFGNPFTDVSQNAGYITIASDIGMTKGTSETTFSPEQTARREEAAAMLVRVYEKYNSETDWVHGFYAISSFSQRDLTREMDAVSVGWCRMSYSADQGGAYLNTTSAGSNEYNIPAGYEDIASYLRENQTKTHLSVYMDTSVKVETTAGEADICSAVLLDGTQRTKAVNAIVDELTVPYETIGYNPYSGVTIDFEGMKGSALKEGFSVFLGELSAALKPLNKALYVTVQPVSSDGHYYDGYDFRTIGRIADKVILMAHDYNETTMPESLLNSEYYKNTPVTPFAGVYYALRAITDKNTGVEDSSKIALAISFDSVGWELANGKLASTSSVAPVPSTIYSRLKQGAVMGYSQTYRNPYITYTTEEGKTYFVWYEDERSVSDKIELAKLFGIKGVSFWRLGLIPNYSENEFYYNIMDTIK